mmetsp:Transcript_35580/g.83145  ORF Transcript_35580/g.83145 Transcript_35580/m.83145 type:complete len:187 (-) Transcript_35580:212-772(-)
MENYSAQNAFWKSRLRKERQTHDVHCQAYYGLGREEMFPPVRKQCTGEQARQLAIQRMHASASLPEIASKLAPNAGRRRREAALGRPPLGAASHGLVQRSRRPSQQSALSSFPSTPGRSVSSQLTTTSSLRREIAQAVHEQVASIVKPLQEQLEGETLARQRAEAALKEAGLATDIREVPDVLVLP